MTSTGAPQRRPFSRHLADLCRENAAAAPDRLAVISGAVELTYAELDRRIDQFAAGLARLGVQERSTVGVLCTNRWEWLCTAIGAARCGARVAAFNTFARAWDLDYMLEHSKTEVLVAVGSFRTRSYLETLLELIPEISNSQWHSERYPSLREVVIVGDDALPAGCRALTEVVKDGDSFDGGTVATSAADDAFVLYTSGSSARPKAVPLKHYGVIENGFGIGERMRLTADDRVWVSVPLFWSYGAANAMSATFTHQATLVLQEAFEPGEALELIERHRATVAYTLPNITTSLLDHGSFSRQRVASLRTGLTIGTAEDFRRAAEDLGIAQVCNVYGSTETYGNCCVTPAEWSLERKISGQGPPLPGVRLRIRDMETGDLLGPGEVGEVQVTGYITSGYLDTKEADNAVFGEDGWYRTGDLGFLDDEGGLHFAARATEMIKTGGINVAPGEVEEFLLLHEQVLDVGVAGAKDATLGEVVVAFVVTSPDSTLTEAELRSWCKTRIAGFKVPARFYFVSELPKTDTGKLARRRLLELTESPQKA